MRGSLCTSLGVVNSYPNNGRRSKRPGWQKAATANPVTKVQCDGRKLRARQLNPNPLPEAIECRATGEACTGDEMEQILAVGSWRFEAVVKKHPALKTKNERLRVFRAVMCWFGMWSRRQVLGTPPNARFWSMKNPYVQQQTSPVFRTFENSIRPRTLRPSSRPRLPTRS